jgi:phenylalanyl-tRNA synthetase beta chain
MRASLRWLRELVDLPDDAEEVGALLDLLGAKVEFVELLDAAFAGVVVARVVRVESHPSADRLRLATVDFGAAQATVVCGAWNFEEGAVVAYAPPGSRLAGGVEVGERAIRGVPSPGMICSEAELGLGDDAEGILVLADGAAVGDELAATLPLPDVVFDVEITPNRPDLMSMFGLARDLGAYLGTPARAPEVPEVGGTGASGVRVVVDAPDRCPRFTAREIRGVTVAPSPAWLRTRLRAVGVRPVSNVVDVTNYVMMEMGQPLHAFDLDRVTDETVVVRTAREGETLVTLDGEVRTLRSSDLVIADPRRPMGLAGVMGGEDSEVSSVTRRVLLEAAHFEAGGVLLTGKHHGIRSEASARFERGVDPDLPPLASARAAAMIVELGGGEVAGELVDVEAPRPDTIRIDLPSSEVRRLLGVEVAAPEIASILERLGFAVSGDDPYTVSVPSHRPDVTRRADLVEEVARLHGFDRIPERLPKGPGGGLPAEERVRRRLREVLVGAGYHETVSFDFVAAADVEVWGFGDDDPRSRPLPLRNPINEEQGHLRTTLLPGLMHGLRVNSMRNRADAALFEIGTVFLESDGDIPAQPLRIGFATMGRVPGVPWRPGAERDALDASGLVETLFGAFDLDYELAAEPQSGMHPGRSAAVVVDGDPVGAIGEVHPEVAAVWSLDRRVVAGELDAAVFTRSDRTPFAPPSALPPVVFDLAFEVADDLPASLLMAAVEAAAGSRLERLVLFDVFAGPPLEPDRKSLAVRLTFRDPERTLTDDELAPVREAIAAHVADAVDGRIRGG